jgi:arabinose operon protein AraL
MKDVKGFIFDLDGTVYLGNKLIPGAKETIELLRERGKKVVFLTNYPLETRSQKVEKLKKLGIEASIDDVINSIYVLTEYLTSIGDNLRILPIAENVLIQKLVEKGHIITYDPKQTDYVVISWDREFNYEKLNLALQAVRNGAKMIASNPDRTCPVENGEVVPDAAGMIGAIQGVTGKKVDIMVGKPSLIMANFAIQSIGLKPEECVMIGDRVETDMLMGINAGMRTAWVKTGVSKPEELQKSGLQVNYILDSIVNIRDYL